jgi:hypothetical protein
VQSTGKTWVLRVLMRLSSLGLRRGGMHGPQK